MKTLPLALGAETAPVRVLSYSTVVVYNIADHLTQRIYSVTLGVSSEVSLPHKTKG